MVGYSRYKNCEACRCRKVKCDQKKPCCTQCTRGRWDCQYPDISKSFIDEGPRLVARRQNGQRLLGARASASRVHDESKGEAGDHFSQRRESFLFGVQPSLVINESDKLRAEFVAGLTNSHIAARFSVLPLKPYLRYIPARIGESAALDNAIACICAASSGIQPLPGHLEVELLVKSSYVKALNSLQAALAHPNLVVKSETLAAVMLLHMFEFQTKPGQDTWFYHARGIVRLIQVRGPGRFTQDIDGAILEAEMGHITFLSLLNQEHCFIEQSAWRNIIKYRVDDAMARGGQMSSAERDYLLVGAQLPGLLSDYLMLSNEEASSYINLRGKAVAARNDLCTRILAFRSELLEWRVSQMYGLFSTPANTPKTLSQKILESNLPETLYLAFSCSSATFQILANYLLCELQSILIAETLDESSMRHSFGPSFTGNANLKAESVACAKDVRESHSALQATDLAAAEQVTRYMTLCWSQAKQGSLNRSCLRENPIFCAIGDLWPSAKGG